MKHRWFLAGIIFFPFLIVLFIVTQALTRQVMSAQAQTANPALNVVWVSLPGEDKTVEADDIILPVMQALLQPEAAAPTVVAQVSPTPVISASQAPATSPVQATSEPILPQQGGTCIRGAVIDHFHQPQGAVLVVTVMSNGVTQTTQTSGGQFEFRNLPAGEWTVTLMLPDTYQAFTPVTFTVTLSGQENECAEVRFKVQPPTCVDIIKEDDLGIGLPGWVFTATMGTQVFSKATDWQGRTRFDNLRFGDWKFAGESKAGWRPVTGESDTQTITLQPAENPALCRVLKFVNTQIHDSCLVVQKLDVTRGTPGQPVPNVPITLTRPDGTRRSETQTTGQDGKLTFANLPLGAYTVQEVVPPGSLPVGSTTASVSLSQASTICHQVTFQNIQSTCIGGQKVTHLHEGVPGLIITATNRAQNITVSTTTQADGSFRFDNLPLGTWTLWEEQRPGWTAITPSYIDVVATEPRTAGQCYAVRFKNQPPPPCLEVYKLDAYDKVGLANWTITLKPAYGGQAQTKTTDGIGYVRFDNLGPGDYVVSETEQPGWLPMTPVSQSITLVATGVCHRVIFENCQANFVQEGVCKKPE